MSLIVHQGTRHWCWSHRTLTAPPKTLGPSTRERALGKEQTNTLTDAGPDRKGGEVTNSKTVNVRSPLWYSFATTRGLVLSTEKCDAIVSPSVPAWGEPLMCHMILWPHLSVSLEMPWCMVVTCPPPLEFKVNRKLNINFKKLEELSSLEKVESSFGMLNPWFSRRILCAFNSAESWILNTSLLTKPDSEVSKLKLANGSSVYPYLPPMTSSVWACSGYRSEHAPYRE